MIWLSGLRGAMALALALEARHNKALTNGHVILILTLLYSLISVLGIGSILGPIFVFLKVSRDPDEKEITTYEVFNGSLEEAWNSSSLLVSTMKVPI